MLYVYMSQTIGALSQSTHGTQRHPTAPKSIYIYHQICILAGNNNSWIKYCETSYEREGINYFWSIKNSTQILNKLKAKGFQASTISTYDFSMLYTTLQQGNIYQGKDIYRHSAYIQSLDSYIYMTYPSGYELYAFCTVLYVYICFMKIVINKLRYNII